MNLNFSSFQLPFYFIVLCFLSCAQIQKPTGGVVDIYKPSIKKTYPANNQTLFKEKLIAFKFDEFVDYDDKSDGIIISPNIDKFESKIVGKNFYLKINQDLDTSKTYLIKFRNAFKDITEGNKMEKFNFRFSANDKIDSGKIDVFLFNSYQNISIDKASVVLTKNIFPLDKIKYDYIDKSINNLSSFENVDNLDYYIYAFLDSNKNKKYDKGEYIAFDKEKINVKKGNVNLYFFKEVNDSLNYIINHISENSIQLNILNNVGEIIAKDSNLFIDKIEENKYLIVDKLKVNKSFNFYIDSTFVRIEKKNKNKKANIDFINFKDKFIDSIRYDSVYIKYDQIIENIDTNKITFKTETKKINYNYKVEDNKLILINLDPSKCYTLKFDSGAISNEYNTNKTSEIKFCTVKKDSSIVKIEITTDTICDECIIFFENNTNYYQMYKNESISMYLKNNSILNYKIVVDKNRNRKWDSGSLEKFILPEKVIAKSLKINSSKKKYEF